MRQESIFEDGTELLARGPERQAAALDEVAALGADTVRALVVWRDVARAPRSRRVPRRLFVASGFDRYDDLVRGASARGMRVLLTPVGPIPRWASGCPERAWRRSRGCEPSARLYGRFVRELGRRYSGNAGLPRVTRWSLWNEPNQPAWLSPQFARRGGRVVNVAAVRYRALAAAGVRALRATGHGSEPILLGETAPVGRRTGRLARRIADPVTFIRTLLCLPGARRGAGCRGARRLRVTGFAHHPYTLGAGEPPSGRVSPGQISFTNVRVLERLLAAGARRGVLRRGLPVWYTEFGYQTNPPDSVLGVPQRAAARYLNHADFVAARNPRVRSVAQYKLVDDAAVTGFQTGLRRAGTLRRKVAYAAYRLPIWPVRRRRSVVVYGQVRPARRGTPAVAAVQHSSPGGSFRTVRRVTVRSRFHQFRVRVPYRRGPYRLAYRGFTSRSARP